VGQALHGHGQDGGPMAEYQQSRPTPHRDAACNAPFTNLYFQADGRAAPCWLYFPTKPPVWGPDRSIKDIWFGPELEKVRKALSEQRFIGRCQECEHDILAGNRPLAHAYDNDHPLGPLPTMLELELSNLCNLACTMCDGRLSSRIRKEREHLPPLDVPYDDSFVEQVRELLPGLRELRFNGGEPLMQPMVFEILDDVAELRPDLKVTIATNGTVMNRQVRQAMERCNLHFNVSIDSLLPERYATIRIHGDHERLMHNFEELRTYCSERDRVLCVMVNPMRVNWDELAEMVRWCTARDTLMWFNTIRHPEHLALWTLPADELEAIGAAMRAEPLPSDAPGVRPLVVRNNLINFGKLLDQVDTWAAEARDRPAAGGSWVQLTPRATAGS
jgi:MoaA/NifB/PqqE/SkfB family radical SAM enzyme